MNLHFSLLRPNKMGLLLPHSMRLPTNRAEYLQLKHEQRGPRVRQRIMRWNRQKTGPEQCASKDVQQGNAKRHYPVYQRYLWQQMRLTGFCILKFICHCDCCCGDGLGCCCWPSAIQNRWRCAFFPISHQEFDWMAAEWQTHPLLLLPLRRRQYTMK